MTATHLREIQDLIEIHRSELSEIKTVNNRVYNDKWYGWKAKRRADAISDCIEVEYRWLEEMSTILENMIAEVEGEDEEETEEVEECEGYE